MSKGNRVYVGNLPPDVREREIEDVFRKYGKITSLDLRNKKGPPFAFIDFDDSRDADDAIHGRDGYELDGYRIRVEFPRSLRDGGGRDGRSSGGGRYGDSRGGGGGRNGFGGGFSDRRGGRDGGRDGGRGGGNLRRSKFRVLVTGLPPSGSWQDLKDHMREAGDVCYADVNKDGTGSCEFMRQEDMKYAVKKLDDTKFRSHEGETAYIRIKADSSSGGRSRSRSRSRSGSPAAKSRSRSPRRASPAPNGKDGNGTAAASDRSPKRARSASHSRSRSATPRSKSRTPLSRSPSAEHE